MRRDDTESRMVHSFLAAGKRYKKNIFPVHGWTIVQSCLLRTGVSVSTHYDALLTRLYGDYRTLPRPKSGNARSMSQFLTSIHPMKGI